MTAVVIIHIWVSGWSGKRAVISDDPIEILNVERLPFLDSSEGIMPWAVRRPCAMTMSARIKNWPTVEVNNTSDAHAPYAISRRSSPRAAPGSHSNG
jgi:hypothetical protein